MSTVLTSQARRRRTPKRNRRIPTIPTGNTDAEPVDVSTGDTEPRKERESVVLAAEPGASAQVRPSAPCPPSAQGAGRL